MSRFVNIEMLFVKHVDGKRLIAPSGSQQHKDQKLTVVNTNLADRPVETRIQLDTR